MQAYLDDSMADGEVLIIAGYLAPFGQWERFSTDWQELLDMRPPWPIFKMKEIAASNDSTRRERAGWHYRIVERYVTAFVACAVEIAPLCRALAELDMSHTLLSNPYVLAIRAITDLTTQYQHELGIHEPVEFIFDERGEKKHVRAGWEVYEQTIAPHLKARLVGEPRFEKDTEFLPLQAADLIAWHVRQHWLAHKSITTADIDVSWPQKRDIPGYKFNLDYGDLTRNLRRLRQRLVEAGVIPSVTLKVTFSFDPSGGGRSS
jgi:hypothetical protein